MSARDDDGLAFSNGRRDTFDASVNNLSLYLAAVLIWGSTWLAITFQLGKVPPEVSVAYRFALAGFVLLLWALVRRLPLRFPRKDHAWMALQGALLFGLNYVLVYLSEMRISSGLVALIFSLIVFFNIAGTRIFFGTPLVPATLFAAVLGVGGVALIFLPELRHPSSAKGSGLGIIFAIASAASASLGNLVSARNQRRGLPVVQLNLYGMLYGAAFVGIYALCAGRSFTFETTSAYVLSLAYLAVFGSVMAFGAYLTLVGRIGAERAGYAGAAIPIVALLLSVAFEGLRLHGLELTGILLCLAGNVLVLRKRASSAKATK
jgi:drug/metabolite transporter (DMT)-like permease